MAIAGAFGAYSASASKLHTALLTFSLIGIEAILDTNFACPSDKYSVVLVGIYSLSFFLGPAIVSIFLGLIYFPGFHKKDCCPCWSGNWAFIYVVVQVAKPAMIWLLIAMTDGKYLTCFVMAASRYQLDHDFYLFVFQIVGLIVILLVMIVIVFFESRIYSILSSFGCKCGSESESERYRRMNEDNLLQITEDILQEEARQRQKEFVETLLSREDWASYDPGSPNALEELEKITAKWKEEVKRQLEGTGLSWSWPDWAKAGEAPSLGTMLNGGPLRREDLLPPHPPAEP